MKESEKRTHLSHCYQGEYKNICKYGNKDCPTKKIDEDRKCRIVGELVIREKYKFFPVGLVNEIVRDTLDEFEEVY